MTLPIIDINCPHCNSLSEELIVARDLLRKTWYLPAEGSTVPVYRSRLTADDYEAIVQYLELIGADRYVPKKERK
jgi:hypothetical protein